jgi:tetratricopeptide (TPR) repeat protein
MPRTFWLTLSLLLLCITGSAQSTATRPAASPSSASVPPTNTALPSASPAPAAGTAVLTTNAAGTGTLAPPLTNPLGEAAVLYRKGNFEGALAKYQEILKDRPTSPDAFAGEVRVYLKQKNVEKAAQVVEQGLAQANSPRMKVAQAELWFRQGKISEAEKQWVEVINSGYPEARAFLGLKRVRDAIAMYKSAKKMIDKAHDLDPHDPDIQEEWVETLSRSERIKYLETSLAGENNWDAEQRSDIASYLQYLKERSKQKNNSCRLVSNVTHTETPLTRLLIDPQHLRGYGLTVALNGHKNSLMLDTGASGILVKRSIAERAGISKLSETKVWGIGNKGRRNAYLGIADSIKIGELEFQNCPVEVMESRSVAEEDGLIGADVFEKFLVDLDFPNEKLKLSQLPKRPGEPDAKLALKSEDDDSEDGSAADNPKSADAKTPAPFSGPQDRYIAPEMQSYSRVFRFGHDLLVPTSIGDVPNKLFVMDTGSMFNAISPAAAREVTKVHTDGDTIVKGISGRVDKVYSANKAVLRFGNLRQENQDMTAFDTKPISDGVGTEVSGFLGFVMLRFLDIKIDYRDALIDFQYDSKRWNR